MEINLLALIGLCLGTMFFGYFFGLFEGRGQGYRRRKREEQLEVGTRAAPKPAAVTAVPEAPKTGASLLELRDENGQRRLLIDGQRVDTTRLDGVERKRLIDLMLVMRPWIEGGAQRASAIQAPAVAPTSEPTRLASLRGDAGKERGAVAIAGATPAVAQAPAAGAPSQPLGMVAQIDAILQMSLAGSTLAERGVRLTESFDGGVTVVVGKDRYSGVGDVPDAEVRAAIRAAIAEWEKRYTPG